ncbi:hypothetical protein ASC77_10575 [Nocardioides sp. Root1257]|uniref:DUF4349 domain-containing protein n=1 Tax=unclassified Nocardioides TaxID=2615069 RepID=UPI0006FC2122|nr:MULTISPECIES: DUF4349 domain-containing protein [unclassified Nocardioides]KQW49132.1 hypothetical protein ASC77_10575 [Nocardioides sp. Root1257]KRC48306.1 hypothetical protein ASE24_10580 [Nocardioides sp. Root224]
MTQTPARLLVPTLLIAALALTGCSGGDGDSGASGSADAGAPAARAPERNTEDFAELGDAAGGSDDVAAAPAKAVPGKADVAPDELTGQEQALIRKGNVALRADDVGRAQIEVHKVVDRYAGQVTDEKTQSDDDGSPAYTRMVLRIPSDDFDRAIEQLKGVAELESANTNQDDVTTQVIDVKTRLQVQKRSIARITVLFQRAESIRDVMAIESELSQRQADLEALEQQAAYLANQTSLSTIVVSIDQIPEKKKPAPKKDDETGFVAGLSAGWGALSTFAVGLATAAGALLPWLVVVAIVGVPVLLLVRSRRISRAGRTGRTQSTA